MIPIRDKLRSERFPIVTLALILLNVAVFVHELTLSPTGLQELALRFGVVPSRLKAEGQRLSPEGVCLRMNSADLAATSRYLASRARLL